MFNGTRDAGRSSADMGLDAGVRRLDPLNDVLFKYLFASKGNEANLLRLLNDTLGPERSIVSLEYMDRENDPTRYGGRSSFFDVLARTEDGRICHVEVQLGNEGFFFERLVYYAACSFADQLSVSDGYDKLRPVIFVTILNFFLFPEKKESWHSAHRLLDVEDHRCYSDSLEFHFLELPKLRRLVRAGRVEETGLSRMLRYLGRIGGEKEMERLVEQDSGVERVHNGVRSFFRTSGNLALYMMKARAETDYRNAMKNAEERAWARGEARGEARGKARGRAEGEARGRAEGEARGRAEGRAETARRMLIRGLPLEQIVEFTDLSPDEIEALKAETVPGGQPTA